MSITHTHTQTHPQTHTYTHFQIPYFPDSRFHIFIIKLDVMKIFQYRGMALFINKLVTQDVYEEKCYTMK